MSCSGYWIAQFISIRFIVEDIKKLTDQEEYTHTRFAYESHILKAKILGSRQVNVVPVDKPPK